MAGILCDDQFYFEMRYNFNRIGFESIQFFSSYALFAERCGWADAKKSTASTWISMKGIYVAVHWMAKAEHVWVRIQTAKQTVFFPSNCIGCNTRWDHFLWDLMQLARHSMLLNGCGTIFNQMVSFQVTRVGRSTVVYTRTDRGFWLVCLIIKYFMEFNALTFRVWSFVTGITSFGSGCSDNGYNPDVYIRISYYIKWIAQTISQN